MNSWSFREECSLTAQTGNGAGVLRAAKKISTVLCMPPRWCRQGRAIVIVSWLVVLGCTVAGAAQLQPPQLAFLGFNWINSSAEPTRADELQRIHMLEQLFVETIKNWGALRVISVPPDIQKEMAAGADISNCNGCERRYAQRMAADWVAWGTIQKVSNLILNINLYMEDAGTGKLEFVKSVDIRGNTDESWRRGLTYLLDYLISYDRGSGRADGH